MSVDLEMKERFPNLDTSGWLLPKSIEELSRFVRDGSRLSVGGRDEYRLTVNEKRKGPLLLDELKQILWFSPENQLVSVESGVLLSDLNTYLREHGFEIPIGLREACQKECIGDLIAMNLPHWNMAVAGSWRDWVVKMKIVLASGEMITTGADVVKNVTGFDLHKLMIGARHTLGVIAEVTLRVRPVSASKEWPPIQLNHGELFLTTPQGLSLIRKHLREYLEPGEGEYLMEHYIDELSCLILAESLRDKNQVPFDTKAHGHLWRSHVGEYALDKFSETEQRLMKRTKEIFDPTYKLNPGEFGFI